MNIKKICCLLLALFLLGLRPGIAQSVESPNEFRLTLSDGIPLALSHAIAFGIVDAFAGHDVDESETSGLGHWSLGYRRHFSSRFNAGIEVSTQSISQQYTIDDSGSGTRKTNYYSIMPAAEFLYMNRENVKLYGNAMVGLGIFSNKETSDMSSVENTTYTNQHVAFQVNLFGIRVGRKYAGFAEIGVGMKGIFGIGFSARL